MGQSETVGWHFHHNHYSRRYHVNVRFKSYLQTCRWEIKRIYFSIAFETQQGETERRECITRPLQFLTHLARAVQGCWWTRWPANPCPQCCVRCCTHGRCVNTWLRFSSVSCTSGHWRCRWTGWWCWVLVERGWTLLAVVWLEEGYQGLEKERRGVLVSQDVHRCERKCELHLSLLPAGRSSPLGRWRRSGHSQESRARPYRWPRRRGCSPSSRCHTCCDMAWSSCRPGRARRSLSSLWGVSRGSTRR